MGLQISGESQSCCGSGKGDWQTPRGVEKVTVMKMKEDVGLAPVSTRPIETCCGSGKGDWQTPRGVEKVTGMKMTEDVGLAPVSTTPIEVVPEEHQSNVMLHAADIRCLAKANAEQKTRVKARAEEEVEERKRKLAKDEANEYAKADEQAKAKAGAKTKTAQQPKLKQEATAKAEAKTTEEAEKEIKERGLQSSMLPVPTAPRPQRFSDRKGRALEARKGRALEARVHEAMDEALRKGRALEARRARWKIEEESAAAAKKAAEEAEKKAEQKSSQSPVTSVPCGPHIQSSLTSRKVPLILKVPPFKDAVMKALEALQKDEPDRGTAQKEMDKVITAAYSDYQDADQDEKKGLENILGEFGHGMCLLNRGQDESAIEHLKEHCLPSVKAVYGSDSHSGSGQQMPSLRHKVEPAHSKDGLLAEYHASMKAVGA